MFRRLIFCRLRGQEPYLETAMFRVLSFSQLFLELCWAILFCMIGFDCLSTSNLFCFNFFLKDMSRKELHCGLKFGSTIVMFWYSWEIAK